MIIVISYHSSGLLPCRTLPGTPDAICCGVSERFHLMTSHCSYVRSYDHFVHRFSRSKTRSDGISAVGVQISLDKIAIALAAFQSTSAKTVLKDRRSYGYWSPRRCDVYVAAHSSDLDGTLVDRLKVTSWLWKNSISADMMYDFGSGEHESIMEQCVSEGIL